eukprot:6201015-Pleurochrysis_carterae.AAC.3
MATCRRTSSATQNADLGHKTLSLSLRRPPRVCASRLLVLKGLQRSWRADGVARIRRTGGEEWVETEWACMQGS